MAANGLYAQYPIQKGEIRILLLDPSPKYDTPLRARMKIISLDFGHSDNAGYEALSYTWGPPVEAEVLADEVINICGKSKTIKGNLMRALRRLRQRFDVRRLWVDAICINQDDPQERGQQVAIMGKIFSSSIMTHCWVGEDSYQQDGLETISACRALHHSQDCIWNITDSCLKIDGQRNRRLQKTMSEELENDIQNLIAAQRFGDPNSSSVADTKLFADNPDNPPVLDSLWVAFVRFFGRRYFSRMWIIQEVEHSCYAEIRCGANSIPWTMFREAIECFRLVANCLGIKLGFHFQLTPALKAIERQTSKDASWVDLLTYMRFAAPKAFCEDPRDRVYALVSLLPSVAIYPDYTISLETLWLRLANIIARNGGLDFLLLQAASQIHEDSKRLQLPSWVPDFLLSFDFPPSKVRKSTHPDCEILNSQSETSHPILRCSVVCKDEVTRIGNHLILGLDRFDQDPAALLHEAVLGKRKRETLRLYTSTTRTVLARGETSFPLQEGDLICHVSINDDEYTVLRRVEHTTPVINLSDDLYRVAGVTYLPSSKKNRVAGLRSVRII